MKKILVLGATGKLGQVLVQTLIENNFYVKALVRNPQKIKVHSEKLKIIKGNVTDEKDLAASLENVDAVVSVLGHGIRTKFPIQEVTMRVLLPLMENKGIKRLIAVTGEGLLLDKDSVSFLNKVTSKLFSVIDPYRMSDAFAQQKLIEKSSLDYTVVRTPIHTNKKSIRIRYSGIAHPSISQTVSRKAVANFIVELLKKNTWIRKSPIIY